MNTDPVELMSSVVLPVMRRVLNPGGVSEVSLVSPGSGGPPELRVQLPGAVFRLELWTGDGEPGMALHLFSELQDFVADHDFAWGEARPPCPRGHAHAAKLIVLGRDFELACPDDAGHR
jgi:hypothetical protein